MYDAFYGMNEWAMRLSEWAMRLQVNECTMRLWDEWTVRLRVNECTMRLWNEWAMRLCVCFFFFFLSLCGCCGYVDMKCHAPMRPMFAAQ